MHEGLARIATVATSLLLQIATGGEISLVNKLLRERQLRLVRE
jgi:hypothetical protein